MVDKNMFRSQALRNVVDSELSLEKIIEMYEPLYPHGESKRKVEACKKILDLNTKYSDIERELSPIFDHGITKDELDKFKEIKNGISNYTDILKVETGPELGRNTPSYHLNLGQRRLVKLMESFDKKSRYAKNIIEKEFTEKQQKTKEGVNTEFFPFNVLFFVDVYTLLKEIGRFLDDELESKTIEEYIKQEPERNKARQELSQLKSLYLEKDWNKENIRDLEKEIKKSYGGLIFSGNLYKKLKNLDLIAELKELEELKNEINNYSFNFDSLNEITNQTRKDIKQIEKHLSSIDKEVSITENKIDLYDLSKKEISRLRIKEYWSKLKGFTPLLYSNLWKKFTESEIKVKESLKNDVNSIQDVFTRIKEAEVHANFEDLNSNLDNLINKCKRISNFSDVENSRLLYVLAEEIQDYKRKIDSKITEIKQKDIGSRLLTGRFFPNGYQSMNIKFNPKSDYLELSDILQGNQGDKTYDDIIKHLLKKISEIKPSSDKQDMGWIKSFKGTIEKSADSGDLYFYYHDRDLNEIPEREAKVKNLLNALGDYMSKCNSGNFPTIITNNEKSFQEKLLNYNKSLQLQSLMIKSYSGKENFQETVKNLRKFSTYLKPLNRLETIILKASPKDIEKIIKEIQSKYKLIEIAKPVFMPEAQFESKWYLNASDACKRHWNLENTRVYEAHETTKGNKVKVAVIDTGCFKHNEFKEIIKEGYNVIDPNKPPNDGNGHGTHVAGIVAGICVGIAHEAEVYPVKVLDDSGWGTLSDVVEGINWCIENGIQVINLSLGSGSPSKIEEQAIIKAYESGIFIAAAAGNNGDNSHTYPASYEHVTSVTAVDKNNEKAWFSQYNNMVDIAAPGLEIYSSWPKNKYKLASGTSMATPHVAGIAALVKSENIDMNPDQVENALKTTALELEPDDEDSKLKYGAGLIQADKALEVEYVESRKKILV